MHGKLVLDWRKKQSTRAEVEETIKKTLDSLPGIYIPEIYHRKCEEVYLYVQQYFDDSGNLPAA